MRSQDENELIALAKSGDGDAFERLLHPYEGKLRRLLIRMLKNHADVEDLLQDVRLRAWQKLASFRGDSRFYTWMYRMTLNLALNFLARRHTDPLSQRIGGDDEEDQMTQEADDSGDVTASLEAGQRLAQMAQALEALPEQLRIVFTMRHLEGLSYEAIAVKLHIPIGTVRSRLHRARVALGWRRPLDE